MYLLLGLNRLNKLNWGLNMWTRLLVTLPEHSITISPQHWPTSLHHHLKSINYCVIQSSLEASYCLTYISFNKMSEIRILNALHVVITWENIYILMLAIRKVQVTLDQWKLKLNFSIWVSCRCISTYFHAKTIDICESQSRDYEDQAYHLLGIRHHAA